MAGWEWDDSTGLWLDREQNLALDEDAGLITDLSTQDVFDTDEGEYLGTVDQVYGHASASAEGDDLSDYSEFQAAYDLARLELREEIQDIRERDAAEQGYRQAHRDADAYAQDVMAAEAEADQMFDNTMSRLSLRLGVPITANDSRRIWERLPDNFTDVDVDRAAADLHIHSGRTGKSAQRAKYMNERINQLDQEADFEQEYEADTRASEPSSGGGKDYAELFAQKADAAAEPEFVAGQTIGEKLDWRTYGTKEGNN